MTYFSLPYWSATCYKVTSLIFFDLSANYDVFHNMELVSVFTLIIYCPQMTFVCFLPLLLDVPSNGLYFMTYEYMKYLLTSEGERLVWFWLPLLFQIMSNQDKETRRIPANFNLQLVPLLTVTQLFSCQNMKMQFFCSNIVQINPCPINGRAFQKGLNEKNVQVFFKLLLLKDACCTTFGRFLLYVKKTFQTICRCPMPSLVVHEIGCNSPLTQCFY